MSTTEPNDMPPEFAAKSVAAKRGVITMPRRFEKEALHIAAATLPLAIDVKAMEDWTVDGRKHRNSNPV
jgi:hypothetical protein